VLRKGTTFERYETPSGHVYPKIRTFFHPHPNADKLPKDIPLLVFTHGLGGSAAQFALLLNSLVNIAPCLAIDLPGCGLSDFRPTNIEPYTTTALAELLYTAIDRFRDKENDQKVVLIGHSMGCSVSALLASSTSPLAHLCSDHVIGMIAMCPRSSPLSEHEIKGIKFLSKLPLPVFEVMRFIDRRGGLHSVSVTRMAGKEADAETRKFQLRFNQQSRSATYLAMTGAMLLQEQHATSNNEESLLSKRVWAGIRLPLCIVAAKGDTITPPSEALQISSWLNEVRKDSVTEESSPNGSAPTSSPPHLQVRTLGPQISHALPYTPSVIRLLTGAFESFLSNHISRSLNPGIQLQLLTTTGKWDVKNFEKWRKVLPCSPPIAGVFRAMKTMREADDEHCPEGFVERFGRTNERMDGVWAVVDISHGTPVYDPQGLESRGVKYVKFPTVSKLPPSADDVEGFIGTIDRLREEWVKEREDGTEGQEEKTRATIGVHCHYGYNRTGYLLVCYLVEKLGWTVADAVEAFAKAKPPGIKHDFFVDELYVRYEG
jgi:pimeloyl-ACP methyl ester carboxylesterase